MFSDLEYLENKTDKVVLINKLESNNFTDSDNN
jgi:hypothetical protein